MCSWWHSRQILHTCRHFVASAHISIHLRCSSQRSLSVSSMFVSQRSLPIVVDVSGMYGTNRGWHASVVSMISNGWSRVAPRLSISVIWAIILAGVLGGVLVVLNGVPGVSWKWCVWCASWCAWCSQWCAWCHSGVWIGVSVVLGRVPGVLDGVPHVIHSVLGVLNGVSGVVDDVPDVWNGVSGVLWLCMNVWMMKLGPVWPGPIVSPCLWHSLCVPVTLHHRWNIINVYTS